MMHPRLFQALAFLEPTLQRENPTGIDGPMVARGTSRKPDLWKSRQDAEAALRKGTFLRPWDPKAVERYLRFGLREVPTAVYPLSSKVPVGSVTLTTTKAQEAWTLLRMNATTQITSMLDSTSRYTSPDLTEEAGEDDCNNTSRLMNCPAPCMAFELLPYVRPPVLYVFGSKSHISRPERQKGKLERTGTGLGGSGGASMGRVKAKTITTASHMTPMEKPTEAASILGQWMGEQKNEYEAEKDFHQNHDSGKSVRNQTTLSPQWMQIMDKPAGAPRSLKSSL
ncbi:MAG: hypothetical protein M1822_003432 [Bathelium mastoideum]|nr:MAG: hypothetical protein M1822_003432 [Bathelium mastoideum]